MCIEGGQYAQGRTRFLTRTACAPKARVKWSEGTGRGSRAKAIACAEMRSCDGEGPLSAVGRAPVICERRACATRRMGTRVRNSECRGVCARHLLASLALFCRQSRHRTLVPFASQNLYLLLELTYL
eukprot:2265167-Pleurochrysis_carterae.AAC.4